ncbi:MAG TPA: hypothetical protein VFW20_09855, partial [Candidatus Limnocylindrales bacterium]|nr:hypothetical protein [Candidatus Limnocylindrales bacterium]
MERARLAIVAALLSGLVLGGGSAVSVALTPAGAVAWPPSTGLLVSEVQTGGASASDEFIELTNASAGPLDLLGLEVVYVTSTGGTVTRKASWATSRAIDPGQHLLVANVSGIEATLADATYSGGLAATGGAVVLRPIGGSPIDAIAWGDAANAFVEGVAAAAPPAGSSLERLPGGSGGNTLDTNVNGSDWFVQGTPDPQNLAAAPVPAPGPSSTPAPTVSPSPAPSAEPSPSPSATPLASPSDGPLPTDTPSPTSVATESPSASATAEPSVEPSVEPTPPMPTPAPTEPPAPSATPEPTSTPSPTASAGPPSPEPSPIPSASSTPEPSPTETAIPSQTAGPSPTPVPIVSIASARAMPTGARATIMGILTTKLGALDAGRTGFVQDDTAGIALYLDATVLDGISAGSVVVASGTLDDRYAERVLRVSLADVVALGDGSVPAALSVDTGAVDETLEGLRVHVTGITVGSASAFADGLGLLVDDGTGSLRAIIGGDALAGMTVPA